MGETYLKEMGIRYFDVVFLLTAERFTEAELKLKEEFDAYRVPYMVVRTKVDVTLDAKINEEGEIVQDENEDDETGISSTRMEELKEETVAELRDYFKKEYDITTAYLIASQEKHRASFDYSKMM